MSDSPGAWLRWLGIAAGLCAILILPVVWDASQGWLFPDGTSYLDMASGAVHEVARRPAKERILEPRVSGDSGVDDGRGPARARRWNCTRCTFSTG